MHGTAGPVVAPVPVPVPALSAVLQQLDLKQLRFTMAGLAALLSVPWPRLERLKLSCDVGALLELPGARLLVQAAQQQRLQRLKLPCCNLRAREIEQLAGAVQQLRHLDISQAVAQAVEWHQFEPWRNHV